MVTARFCGLQLTPSAMSSPVAAPSNALTGGSFFFLGDIAVYGLPFLVGGGLLILFVWGLFVVADQHRDFRQF